MTDLEQRLRADLDRAAHDYDVPSLPHGADYRERVTRRTPFVAGMAVAASVVVLLAAVVIVVTREPSGIPAAKGGPAFWPARGSRAADISLTDAARRTWEASPLPARELPHRDVHVLYAERTIAGDVVVLTGVDALGHRRIAELGTDATSTTAFRHRLHLIADLLAPTGDKEGLIAIDAPRHTPRKSDDKLLVVLAAPGTTTLQWRAPYSHWQSLTAVDGAGTTVHVSQTPDTYVRSGTSGGGVRTMGDFFGGSPMSEPVEHDLSPEEVPSSSGSTETCNGNVCSGSATTSGTISPTPDKASWTDLLVRGPDSSADWWEFADEIALYTDGHFSADSTFVSPGWSGLLRDGAGVFTEQFSPNGGPRHLLVYVDRPDWFGGQVLDLLPHSGLRALALDVSGTSGRSLDLIVTDGLTAQWSANDGPWHDAAVRAHTASLPVARGVTLRWRVLDERGVVVAQGTPHVISPR